MPSPEIPDCLPFPGDDEVHVWTVLVSETLPRLSSLENTLSPNEKSKAARFVQPDDRRRFIAAHGILRLLLGRYLSVAPAALAFVNNPFGKPALVRQDGESPLSFNLTHSGDVVAFVIAAGRNVGVDVETIRNDWNLMELARAQFSDHEIGALQSLGSAEQAAAFFRCWTRKEAYIKARGEGLGFPLKQFSVAFGENDAPAVLWVADEPTAPGHWSMFDLAPAPGYAGAVAVEGRPVRLVTRQWGPL